MSNDKMFRGWRAAAIATLAATIATGAAGCGGDDPGSSVAVTESAPAAMTTTTAEAESAGAPLDLLTESGFTALVGGDSPMGGGAQVYNFRGLAEDGQLTLQPDNELLRQQYEKVEPLGNGIEVAVQRTGYNAISVAVFNGERAAILSLLPDDSGKEPSLSEAEAVNLAVRFLGS